MRPDMMHTFKLHWIDCVVSAIISSTKRYWNGVGWTMEKQEALTYTYGDAMRVAWRMKYDGITSAMAEAA